MFMRCVNIKKYNSKSCAISLFREIFTGTPLWFFGQYANDIFVISRFRVHHLRNGENMRFLIPPAVIRDKIFPLDPNERPFSLRFAVMLIPFGICIALVSAWIGYKAVSPAFRDSLNAVPLLKAKMQADRMEEILKQLRHSLFSIAEQGNITERSLRNSLRLFFPDTMNLVQEIGFRDAQHNGFMLLRDKDGFTRFSAAEASHGLYSPFQQLNTVPLLPGQAVLYPPVYFNDPAQQSQHAPVMRLALMLPDGSGVLVLGIGLAELGQELYLPSRDGALHMSFFFDTRGWILFETSNISNRSFLPDLSREGYRGDLGRPGYDAAFRPWAAHKNFWRMVTDVQAGVSGHMPAPAEKYPIGNPGATGLLSFVPVAFASSDDAPPVVQGGIAFFETSTLPLAAFLRLANYSIVILVSAIVLSALLAFFIHRRLAIPLNRMTKALKNLADSGELAFINTEPAFEEQRDFQTALNSIIAGSMNTRNELERLTHEVEHARSRLPVDLSQGKEASFDQEEFDLVGSSALIREVREHLHKAARAGTDVLIWGETGTGKELVAGAIHKASTRHSGPYISINCGALDENLLLDTLFGHVRGAFTEAKHDRKGAFLAAHGGTLHLDELANASLKVQQALLRALSVRRIRPLGTDEEIPFDTRVVASTNVDLRQCVRDGAFREDLYYRLAIISIETPPLRHRKEDIPALASHCIRDAAAALGRQEARLSQGALDLMYTYDWPGNVREFKNCLTRALAFVEDDLILAQHIILEHDPGRPHAKLSSSRFPDASRQQGQQAGPDGMSGGAFDAQPHHKASSSSQGSAPKRPETGMPQEHRGMSAPTAAYPTAPSSSSVTPPSLDNLNERQLRALHFARKQGRISRPQFEEVAGVDVSARTLQNDLRELVERGIFRRIGAGPATYYEPSDHSK